MKTIKKYEMRKQKSHSQVHFLCAPVSRAKKNHSLYRTFNVSLLSLKLITWNVTLGQAILGHAKSHNSRTQLTRVQFNFKEGLMTTNKYQNKDSTLACK